MKASALPLHPLSPQAEACGLVSFRGSAPKSMFTPVSRKSEQRQTDPDSKLTLPPAKTRLSSALTPLLLALETGYSPTPIPF